MKEWVAIVLTVITLIGGSVYLFGFQASEVAGNTQSITELKSEFSNYKQNHGEYHANHDTKILDLLHEIKVETSTTRVKVEYIDEDVKLMKRGLKF